MTTQGNQSTSSSPPEPRTAADTAHDDAPVAEHDGANASATSGPLVPEDAAMDFRSRWDATQQGFVDEPRTAVTDADKLVADVLQRLSATFEAQHAELERQWSDGEPSTEELRTALQRYRTFFERLLTV